MSSERKSKLNLSGNRQSASFLALLNDIDKATASENTHNMIEEMLTLIIKAAQANSAHYFHLDTAADEFVITHISGDTTSNYLIGLHVARQQGMAGLLEIDNLSSPYIWQENNDPSNPALRNSSLNLPVQSKNTLQGIIKLYGYQQPDGNLIAYLIRRLSHELEHRSALANIQQSNHRLLQLVEMLGNVAGTLDRNRLLHFVTESAARLVNAERSSLFLIDPATREMIFQVAYQPTDNGTQPEGSKTIEPPEKSTHGGDQPRSPSEGSFSYFNRSSITVPLSSDSFHPPDSDNREHILGGLMVLNKPRGAFQKEDAQLMQILANQASIFLQVAEMYEASGELFLGVIKSLIAAIDAKDPYTQGHSQRVSDYSVLIARELGFDEQLINTIRIGSLLHDIGKIGIPDSILKNTNQLSSSEMLLVRDHPRTGVNILREVKLLEPMMPAILEHHERLDGSGYPEHLVEKQISSIGKIVAVADVFDAMTSNRPYRPAVNIHEVQSYLNDNAGILFDSSSVRALTDILSRSV